MSKIYCVKIYDLEKQNVLLLLPCAILNCTLLCKQLSKKSFFLSDRVGKCAVGSPEGKRLQLPMHTRTIRVISALLVLLLFLAQKLSTYAIMFPITFELFSPSMGDHFVKHRDPSVQGP